MIFLWTPLFLLDVQLPCLLARCHEQLIGCFSWHSNVVDTDVICSMLHRIQWMLCCIFHDKFIYIYVFILTYMHVYLVEYTPIKSCVYTCIYICIQSQTLYVLYIDSDKYTGMLCLASKTKYLLNIAELVLVVRSSTISWSEHLQGMLCCHLLS